MLMPTSAEFVALCRAQVALLTQGLGASLGVVYLAEELMDGAETQLIPVVAYPETAIDWREHITRSPLTAISERQSTPRLLADSTQELTRSDEPLLESLFSFDTDGAQTGATGEASTVGSSSLLAQRQLVLPLIHEGVVLGLLVTGRDDRAWSEWEQAQIQQVANTLALACVLDHRYQWLEQDRRQQRLLQAQQHDLLDNLLHQFRNSLTALQTFGKLILKRLLPGDSNHEIAASLVREATRLSDLSQQLEAAMAETAVSEVPSLAPGEWQTRAVEQPPDTQPTPLLLPGAGFLAGAALPLERCAVVDVLEPLLASAESIAQERNLILHTKIPVGLPPVATNAQALREVLNNLIENALKYTPPDGHIWVQVALLPLTEPNDSACLEIAITDTGPGIPPQDLSHIFERRYRGVQAHGVIPGSGLGLAIAQALVKQIQGKIQVFSPGWANHLDSASIQPSAQGLGTTFTVQLPLAENE